MATFQISKSVSGAYLYVLKDGTNKVILRSCKHHTTKIACHCSIALVRANAGSSDRYVSTDIPGYHWFTLRSTYGERLGMSKTYVEACDRDQGLWHVMKVAFEADTEDRS